MKLKVKGLSLLDDLGNTKTSDGRRLKLRHIYRSSYLIKIDKDAEKKIVEKYHIHHCVDFRTDEEVTNFPEIVDSEIKYYHFPMLENHENKMITKENRLGILKEMSKEKGGAKQSMIRFYGLLATSTKAQKAYRDFVHVLLNAKDNEGVVFHCTQGKDRTGLAAAYLLSALGVDRETIIADFDKTNQVYARDVRKFCRRVKFFGGKEEELAVVKAFIGANTENFIRALDLINAEYGSMDAYLRNILGLTNADFEILKGRYLTSTID